MSQPAWITNPGDLGVFPSGVPININVRATPAAPAVRVTYTLLNGSLPEGIESDPIVFSVNGTITGTPKNVGVETNSTFSVRATDNLGNFKDRTFSIRIFGFNNTYIRTPNGFLFSIQDSTPVNYQLDINNPIETNEVILSITGGEFPPGLQLTPDGKIVGYATPPELLGTPVDKDYEFTVVLLSNLGDDTKRYIIRVTNQELRNPPNTRVPVILNNLPLVTPVDISDPYRAYYLPEDNIIPMAKANEFFNFKIIGHDFDKNAIRYQYGVLPPGLTGDPYTGWITGIPQLGANSISRYSFAVNVCKLDSPEIVSGFETYTLTVTSGIIPDIEWQTDADLGIVFNGSISNLEVKATSDYNILYKLVSGSLPPNIILTDNGELMGRFPYQPNSQRILEIDETTVYRFTISAFNPRFPIVENVREFTLTLYQKYSTPTENLYFKATPDVSGRQIINNLLSNTDVIPNQLLYRPNDVYFGKSTDVNYVHVYGMNSYDISAYLPVVQQNFYNRKFVLGELKTAIARDESNNIIYEVVYSEIIDDLINESGVSIPQEILWPTELTLSNGPYYLSNDELYISSTTVDTSYSPGSVPGRKLYPASTINMKNRLLETLVENDSVDLLPKWMTSQQTNGSTLGYVRAWVICYTIPRASELVKFLIDTYWPYKLNQVDFSVDRLYVDKSGTYNFNNNLMIPQWTDLPSATPTPTPINEYDISVMLPRKTIFPENTDY